MSDWLDDFQMMGVGLNEGEKTLMRFAISKERRRFISLIDNDFWHHRIAGNEKPTCVSDCPTCELIFLVNDVNIL